jgi:hypothetical protein
MGGRKRFELRKILFETPAVRVHLPHELVDLFGVVPAPAAAELV